MANKVLSFDRKTLVAEFENQFWSTRQAVGLCQNIIESKTMAARDAMIKTFENSKITQELEGGDSADNVSNTINYSASDAEPNLFTFFGFPKGMDPIEPLRNYLSQYIEISHSTRSGSTHYFKVHAPTRDGIESVTILPWEGSLSWAAELEKSSPVGISMYLRILQPIPASRSGGGIEVSFRLTEPFGNSFNSVNYIDEILEAFRAGLEQATNKLTTTLR